MPDFRPCSTCLSRSEAPFCHCTLRAIPIRAEGTFGRLRYSLGGDRPSQTTHLARSHHPIQGGWLELSHTKCGIPPSSPRSLTRTLPRLPHILFILRKSPMPSCSKALWGLYVQSRVTCIFTGISISPSPSLRQRPNRYAFRAGRNLPDKEFRYLRTVIVTAAVYRGFGSMLRVLPP